MKYRLDGSSIAKIIFYECLPILLHNYRCSSILSIQYIVVIIVILLYRIAFNGIVQLYSKPCRNDSETRGPISSRAVLRSKLVDKQCYVQISVVLVGLAVRSSVFSETLINTGQKPLERPPPSHGAHSPAGPGPSSGQLALILQATS